MLGQPELVGSGMLPNNPEEHPTLVADNRRLRRELGWQQETSLQEGLARTIEWWRGEAHG